MHQSRKSGEEREGIQKLKRRLHTACRLWGKKKDSTLCHANHVSCIAVENASLFRTHTHRRWLVLIASARHCIRSSCVLVSVIGYYYNSVLRFCSTVSSPDSMRSTRSTSSFFHDQYTYNRHISHKRQTLRALAVRNARGGIFSRPPPLTSTASMLCLHSSRT